MRLKAFAVFILFIFGLMAQGAESPDLGKFARMAADGNVVKAYDALKAVEDNKFAMDKLHLKYFALGNWAMQLKKYSEVREHLEKSLRSSLLNAAYAHYLIGHSYKEEGQLDKALKSFQRALDFNPTQNIIFQTRFEEAEIALATGRSARAREHLTYLERRWRGTPKHPEIVWKLLGVELKDNRRNMACRWARKMYVKYPGHPLAADWGVELQHNKYNNSTIGCFAANKELRERVRKLQLSGLDEKARKEIDYLRSHSRPNELAEADMILVSFLENQGFPDEGLQILVPHYEEMKTNFNYQTQLGKVAARAGEFQTAVGAYYNAYRLSPRSKNGKQALYTSAFLSYQIQDYDGAHRKFADFARKFPGSGLSRDARWHLAWIQYLKTDYTGSEKSFRTLLNEQVRLRRRRVSRPFLNDRTKYWLAMSLVRQEKYADARAILTPLAEDKSLGFYSLVAKNRLAQMPGTQPRALANIPADTGEAPEKELVASNSPSLLFSPNGEKEEVAEGEESEENLQAAAAADDDTESPESEEETPTGPQLQAAGEDATVDEVADTDTVQVTAFRDPRLRERFQRANWLMTLGLNDWAKWELFEIERRTRNKTYLRMLMDAYQKIGSYNRVAYISEIYFGSERMHLGLSEGKDLWQFNFPKAFDSSVEDYAKKFGVSQALILAIMRAESQFNAEATSPVGARGLMQLMPYTADQLTRLLGEKNVVESDLLVPDVNIRLGSRYLSRLEKKFSQQIPLVAAGYNAGPHRVYSWLNSFGSLDMDEFIEHVPFLETRNYIKKVVRNFAVYSELYGGKPDTFVWLTEPIPFKVTSRPSPRENWESID